MNKTCTSNVLRYSPHTCYNGYYQREKIINAGKELEEREPLCTTGRKVNFSSVTSLKTGLVNRAAANTAVTNGVCVRVYFSN